MVTQVALYARVSSDMQIEGFSIDVQLKEMREFAAKEGWTIVREYVDEGYSARSGDRPQFQVLLRDVQARLFDGLLVHKLDRLYRNLLELLQFVHLLREREVSLVSVHERFDFNSIPGEMMLSLMGGLSEVYVRNLREETMKGKYGRVLKGLWNGIFPFGYCQGRCSRCQDPNGEGYCPDYGKPDQGNGDSLIAHPKDSSGVQLMFSSFHSRKFSCQGASELLNRAGYRTRTKHPFSPDAVCDLLRNRFYAQWVVYKGEQHRGLHPALVDQRIFDECQAILAEHARSPRSNQSRRRFFLLSGLVRCSQCGYTMTGHTNRQSPNKAGERKEKRFYRDRSVLMGFDCTPILVDADELEACVDDYVRGLCPPEEWKERIMLLAQSNPKLMEMDRERRELRSQLSRLQGLYIKREMTADEFERSQRLLKRKLGNLDFPLSQNDKRVERCLADFGVLWDWFTRDEKKEIIHKIVRAVYVKQGILDRIELHDTFKVLLQSQGPP